MADFIPLPAVRLQGVGSGIGSAVDVCHHLMGRAGSLVRKGSGGAHVPGYLIDT